MATKQLFTNNAISTLNGAVASGATSLVVATGDGAKFPSPGANEYFLVTLIDASGNYEVVKVTARTSDSFDTIVRAQEGTTAIAFADGDKVELRLTKGGLERLSQLDADETVSGNKTHNGNVTHNGGLTVNGAMDGTYAPWSTGDVKLTIKTAADTGWIMCDDGTIGDASSGATTRANADTSALFTLLWNNVSDTYAAVSGGRGASASADFAAHKTIALTKMLGRALALSGSGSGLTARSLGQTTGEETHTDSANEMPAHSHVQTVYAAVGNSGNIPIGYANVGSDVSGPYSTHAAGGGAAHNNMQPTSFLNAMIKL